MSFMWKVLAVMGLGGVALLLYNEMSPECKHNMKESLDKMANKTSNKVKNMME